MFDWMITGRAIFRSLRIYYGDRPRHAAMDAIYARFIKPGDIAFDVAEYLDAPAVADFALEEGVFSNDEDARRVFH